MGQKLIISEEDRSQINKMYELVNEQQNTLPPCSKFKNFIDGNLGYPTFYPSWDNSGNMILVAGEDNSDSFPNNPLVKDKPFCKCCIK